MSTLHTLAEAVGIYTPVTEAAAKQPTYDQARAAILDQLAKEGWEVKASLKIPHATMPNGQFRLWFKKQAVYYTGSPTATHKTHGHDFGNARSLWVDDIRKTPTDQFLPKVLATMKRMETLL